MRILRPLPFIAALALGACGGSQSASQSFIDAAPSYSALAFDQTAIDTSDPSITTASGAALRMDLDSTCHPHLFLRSHEVVNRINRHFYKVLRLVEQVISKNAQKLTTDQVVWEKVKNGVDLKLTVSAAGEVYTWTLELAPEGSTTFTTVFNGNIDRTGAAGPHQGKGELTLDFDSYAKVITTERARGVIQVQFDITATSRLVVVDAANVAWDVIDDTMPMGALGNLDAPRSGHYVYSHVYGQGGSLKLTDQMLLFCPSNPQLKLANVSLVQRWYRTAAGAVNGRSDALFTDGQLPDHSIAKVVGVTCHTGATATTFPTESYWMMKSEDATGATMTGGSLTARDTSSTDACDPVLGAVPSMTDSSTDFVFPTDMSSDTPYPIPTPPAG